jgi:GDSL-like lipase/acylhydrolase family protein
VKRRTLKRLAVAIVLPIGLLTLAEFGLRRAVPNCGVTPFRVSQTPGLASEFRPGFTTLYKGFEVTFNSQGYRGAEFPAPEPGLLRIALVGDSFTFGSAVDLADTLAVRLEAALDEAGTPARVLNLGVPGYAAGNVAAVVRSDALDLEPDVIVYVFYANDIDRPPTWQEIPPDAVIDGMHGFPAHSALLQWLNVRVKQAALRWFGKQLARRTPAHSQAQWDDGGGQRVREAIERMRDLCAERGVRFLVAGYPHLTLVGKNPFLPIDQGAAMVCAELGVQWIDLVQAFGEERDLTRYWASVFDTHPSGEANRLVARLLALRP